MPVTQHRPLRQTRFQPGLAMHPSHANSGSPSLVVGASPELEFLKTNKWYFIGGALLIGAAVAYYKTRD